MSTHTLIYSITVGALATNCYLLAAENADAVVIDPGDDGDIIVALEQRHRLNVRLILNTHGHCDHCGANQYLRNKTGAPIGIHKLDAPLLGSAELNGASLLGISFTPHNPDFTFADGDVLKIGNLKLKVIHTPGHSEGGCCFFLEGSAGDTPVLFSGDTLFAGSIGRTDLPGCSPEKMKQSLRRLKKTIPPETIIYPGHGPATSFVEELSKNPYLTNL